MHDADIQRYLNKSGDTQLSLGNVVEDEDRGFMIWQVSGDNFVMMNVYGDGRYWDDWATNKAKQLGLKTVMFGTTRKPELYIRRSKYDYKVSCYVLERDI